METRIWIVCDEDNNPQQWLAFFSEDAANTFAWQNNILFSDIHVATVKG